MNFHDFISFTLIQDGDMVKHELQVTSYKLQVDGLKARAKIQKCEFKSTNYKSKSRS